jgi:hypothetical protein
MAVVTITASAVRPLNGAITRRGTAGASGSVGDAVYLDGTNGWKPADADVEAASMARGIVVAVNSFVGATAYESGDRLDIAVFGPVAMGTGMTPGGAIFVSPTAGKIDQSASAVQGDYNFRLGWAEAADIVFVSPASTTTVVS